MLEAEIAVRAVMKADSAFPCFAHVSGIRFPNFHGCEAGNRGSPDFVSSFAASADHFAVFESLVSLRPGVPIGSYCRDSTVVRQQVLRASAMFLPQSGFPENTYTIRLLLKLLRF